MTTEHDGLRILRQPFAAHEISKLPKPFKSDAQKGNCKECGGYHGLPAMHLDYVGHAALTKRLLEADPMWAWEPLALGADGLPQTDKIGGLWIRLTVCGVTRLGYGDAQGKTGPNAVKEAIGDALRNAAMRFGAALDLWHKGDLYDAEELRGLIGTAEAKKSPEATAVAPETDALKAAIAKHHDSIICIKEALKGGALVAAAEAWGELSEDEQRSIWVAPSKGGPFSTQERDQMKSAEFAAAMRHFKEAA